MYDLSGECHIWSQPFKGLRPPGRKADVEALGMKYERQTTMTRHVFFHHNPDTSRLYHIVNTCLDHRCINHKHLVAGVKNPTRNAGAQ